MTLRNHMKRFDAHSERIDAQTESFLDNGTLYGDGIGPEEATPGLLHQTLSHSLHQAHSDLRALNQLRHHRHVSSHHDADESGAHGSETADEQ